VALKYVSGARQSSRSGYRVSWIGAKNLAALRALATGRDSARSSMSLHARQLATAAGASGELVDWIAALMVSEGVIRLERAKELMMLLSQNK
jgi:hydroxymethylglutaryl-CoA reductase